MASYRFHRLRARSDQKYRIRLIFGTIISCGSMCSAEYSKISTAARTISKPSLALRRNCRCARRRLQLPGNACAGRPAGEACPRGSKHLAQSCEIVLHNFVESMRSKNVFPPATPRRALPNGLRSTFGPYPNGLLPSEPFSHTVSLMLTVFPDSVAKASDRSFAEYPPHDSSNSSLQILEGADFLQILVQ